MPKSNLPKNICLVASPGGHFFELYLLKSFWEKYKRFWITFKSPDTEDLLQQEKDVFWCLPVARNPLRYLKALLWSLKILRQNRPSLVLTTGANIGAVVVHAATLLRIKTVYIELTDRIDVPSLSAKLVSPFVTHLLVQWEEMAKRFTKGEYQGRVL